MRKLEWAEMEGRLQKLGENLSDQPTLYRCHHCKDVGLIIRRAECEELYGPGRSAVFSSACTHCEKGDHIARCDEVYNAKERVELHRRRRATADANQAWIDEARELDRREDAPASDDDDDLPF